MGHGTRTRIGCVVTHGDDTRSSLVEDEGNLVESPFAISPGRLVDHILCTIVGNEAAEVGTDASVTTAIVGSHLDGVATCRQRHLLCILHRGTPYSHHTQHLAGLFLSERVGIGGIVSTTQFGDMLITVVGTHNEETAGTSIQPVCAILNKGVVRWTGSRPALHGLLTIHGVGVLHVVVVRTDTSRYGSSLTEICILQIPGSEVVTDSCPGS